MKAQDAVWVDTLLRSMRLGIRPRRTLKMALTCGEEGGGRLNGVGWLLDHHRNLIDAGIAVNEGGGGELDASGRRLAVTVMGQEKAAANVSFELTGPGGHASKPRPDNLLVRCRRAIVRVDQIDFPVELNTFNRSYFSGIAPRIGGEAGAAMRRVVENPRDAAAVALIRQTPAWRAMLTTTCIPTLIEGGHASNAQPQRVKVTYNCRLLPPGDMDGLKATLTEAFGDAGAKVDMAIYNGDNRALSSPLTEAVMGPVRLAAGEVFTGIPVVTMQETFGTDGNRLIHAGIPTYGISGLFRGFDGGNMHGLDEHISVRSVMDGRAFLYRLVRIYADQ